MITFIKLFLVALKTLVDYNVVDDYINFKVMEALSPKCATFQWVYAHPKWLAYHSYLYKH